MLHAVTTGDGEDEWGEEMVIAAFSEDGAAGWQALRATDREIREWTDAGFDATQAAQWMAWCPEVTAAEAVELSTDQTWQPVTGGLELAPWVARGITAREALAWKSTGLLLGVAWPWVTDPGNEFDPATATALIGAGFAHPDEYRWCRTENPEDPGAALLVLRDGDPVPAGDATVALWDDIDRLRRAGLWDPEQITAWRTVAASTGLQVDEALEYQAAGVTPAEFVAWQSAVSATRPDGPGAAPGAFKSWIAAAVAHTNWVTTKPGTVGVKSLLAWRALFNDLTVTAERLAVFARVWRDVPNPSEWITAGFGHETASRWRQALASRMVNRTKAHRDHVYSRYLTPAWAAHGFDPERDHAWIDAALTVPNVAAMSLAERLMPLAALLRGRGGPADPAAFAALYGSARLTPALWGNLIMSSPASGRVLTAGPHASATVISPHQWKSQVSWSAYPSGVAPRPRKPRRPRRSHRTDRGCR